MVTDCFLALVSSLVTDLLMAFSSFSSSLIHLLYSLYVVSVTY